MISSTRLGPLPPPYHIFEHDIQLTIPSFRQHERLGIRTLAPVYKATDQWFEDFVSFVAERLGQEYLPVCRMSDGEFRFLVGDPPPDIRLPLHVRVARKWRRIGSRLIRGRGFSAATHPGAPSGRFSAQEWRESKKAYSESVAEIASRGVLAMHFSHVPGRSFQEPYFPAVRRWLDLHDIELSETNYVPFYFVYAALRGPERKRWIENRNVLLVHGATGDKRSRIIDAVYEEGASQVRWCPISEERAFFDTIAVGPHKGRVDIAFVGAGVGKPNILLQLRGLSVPCIDAGYVFEIWADENCKWSRAYCVPDDQWQLEMIRFLPAYLKALWRQQSAAGR
jgi:hypothetical protein